MSGEFRMMPTLVFETDPDNAISLGNRRGEHIPKQKDPI